MHKVKQKPETPKQASVKNFLNIVKSWGKKKELKGVWKNKSFDEDNLPIG